MNRDWDKLKRQDRTNKPVHRFQLSKKGRKALARNAAPTKPFVPGMYEGLTAAQARSQVGTNLAVASCKGPVKTQATMRGHIAIQRNGFTSEHDSGVTRNMTPESPSKASGQPDTPRLEHEGSPNAKLRPYAPRDRQ